MCLLRRPAATLVARVARHVPVDIARDSVQHSWPAYRDALGALLDDNPLPAWISAPARPTTIVLGDADLQAPAGDVLDSAHDAVDVVLLDGDHLILLERPGAVAELIAAARERRSDAWSEPIRGRGAS